MSDIFWPGWERDIRAPIVPSLAETPSESPVIIVALIMVVLLLFVGILFWYYPSHEVKQFSLFLTCFVFWVASFRRTLLRCLGWLAAFCALQSCCHPSTDLESGLQDVQSPDGPASLHPEVLESCSEVIDAGEDDTPAVTPASSIEPSAPAPSAESAWETQSSDSAVTPPTSRPSPFASTEALTWGMAALSLAASRLGPHSLGSPDKA